MTGLLAMYHEITNFFANWRVCGWELGLLRPRTASRPGVGYAAAAPPVSARSEELVQREKKSVLSVIRSDARASDDV